MYSNVKFYEKDNELPEIHFTVKLGSLKGVNTSSENSNTSDFNEIKIILLMCSRNQDLYLGVETDLIIHKWEKCWITDFKC